MQQVRFTIVDERDNETNFLVRPDTNIHRVIYGWREKWGIQEDIPIALRCHRFVDGEIGANDTPQSLGIQDGDIIFAVICST